jgi:hypothetical protein
MKSLQQYLVETEVKQDIPQQGDVFAIELEDGTLLETYIMSVDNDTILLDATPKIIGVLREWADLEGEAGEVLFEGQFKQSMLTAAERMAMEDFVDRFEHLFSAGEAEKFWHDANGVKHNEVDESDYNTEIDVVDRGEYDREGDMAKDDLATIIRAARKLNGMLDDDENMPEWVQSKINKAADYVDTAADYIESNKQRAMSEGSESDFDPTDVENITDTDFRAAAGTSLRGNITADRDALIRAFGMPDSERDMWVLRFGNGLVATIYTDDSTGTSGQHWKIGGNHPDTQRYVDAALNELTEAKYQGREVKLGKPTRGDVKKFKVYVRDPSTGNIKKVNFGHGGTSAKRLGQKTMKIKKSDPARRRSFRARHNCDNPGSRLKARYWSCRAW